MELSSVHIIADAVGIVPPFARIGDKAVFDHDAFKETCIFCCLGGNIAVIAVGKRGEIVKARRHGDALAGRGDKRNVNGVCAAVFGVAVVWIGDIHRIRTYLPELKLRAHRTVSVPYLQTQTAARKLVLSGKQLFTVP